MSSVNVQFREDESVVEFVKRKGLKPSDLAKRGFEKEVRALRAAEHAQALKDLKVALPKGFAERAVREARDSR